MFGSSGYVKNIQDAITAIKNINDSTNATPEVRETAVNDQLAIINTNINSLETALGQYKLKYADLVDQTASDTTVDIAISTSEATGQKAKIQSVLDAVTGDITTQNGTLGTKAGTYNQEYKDWYEADQANTPAQSAWTDAVTAYNTAVGDAKDAYDAAVTAGTGAQDNHGTTIVPLYSANRVANNDNPEIPGDAGFAAYALDDITAPAKTAHNVSLHVTDATEELAIEDGVATMSVAEWDSLKTDKNSAAENAKKAYDDTVIALEQSSTITIYVNLADGYSTNWTFDSGTSGTEKASFYLNSILDAGKTSEMLVDSVELADSVKAGQYKDLTFDLNVHLDSAQVTYAEDKSITTEAVSSWDKAATVDQGTKKVTWS